MQETKVLLGVLGFHGLIALAAIAACLARPAMAPAQPLAIQQAHITVYDAKDKVALRIEDDGEPRYDGEREIAFTGAVNGMCDGVKQSMRDMRRFGGVINYEFAFSGKWQGEPWRIGFWGDGHVEYKGLKLQRDDLDFYLTLFDRLFRCGSQPA